jgi:ferredoxin--NADP+ reductase
VGGDRFVAWYNGHPDFLDLSFDLSGERAVVIGNGNVALDVARMLALTPEELAPTDTTDEAIAAINGSGIREILVVGRRGPVQAAWTPVEVGELGELAGADVIVDSADLDLDPASDAELAAAAPTVRRSVDHLRDYATREPSGKPRAIRPALLLLARGTRGRGEGRGDRARPERARGRPRRRHDERESDPCGIVFRSVGYQGVAPAGFPSTRASDDPERRRPGRAGLYVAGWIKRGPSGVIGTNKKDATETVRCCSRTPGADSLPARGEGTLETLLAESTACEAVLTPAGRRSTRRSATQASRSAPRGSSSQLGRLLAAPGQ